ncbi:hypothetical protein VAE151_630442 [Vibrio aestuarianus]|uniref:Uncharacterized protein n=1 Tax=Vibrio aestuarianus TaxID=28171 RepID=A0ABM9FIH3_9VIBR|nr:hypothetical protein VAE063_1000440 [Vibrio aestuarianus]CAH8220226.1 hypothetical protein VAE308_1150389 [Vibrio aestuarianus]CAH8224946.1 hypothetical protein VAE032_320439 [Vibrio aestuarianus]CAH8224964.1 hypothetical protein VAE055_420443 [Vibrio aestuarianus]CAH8224997.1 hypothetical protein VAE128_500436 [Vibrio aestuarianus]
MDDCSFREVERGYILPIQVFVGGVEKDEVEEGQKGVVRSSSNISSCQSRALSHKGAFL